MSEKRKSYISEKSFEKLKLVNKNNYPIISLLIWTAIIIFSLIALARPLGRETETDAENSGRNIVIAFDISESMKANDVRLSGSYAEYVQAGDYFGLSRFEAAKKILRSFVHLLDGDKLSLVAFSENAFPLSPLSKDHNLFLSFLDNLDFSYSQGGGTNLADAISVASRRFYEKEKSESNIIIIISDGESHTEETEEAAKKAQKQGIKIFSVGIGSKEGSKISLGKNLFGETSYKTYLGEDVITRLNEEPLKEIAKISGGEYIRVNNQDVSKKLQEEIYKVKAEGIEASRLKKYEELFPYFLLISIILLLIDAVLPEISMLINKP